jgi:polar amino acid transport system substrate-binding protein
MMLRRPLLASLASLALLTAALLAGCGTTATQSPKPDAQTVSALAPTGTLRVGVYRGSPSSLVTTPQGDSAGVAHDLGVLLAKRLDVPVQVVTFDRLALVLEALKAGAVDVTFTNASAARQREFAFTDSLLSLELGYLVPAVGKLQNIAAVDADGMRIGVSQGSSTQAALGGTSSGAFKAAKLTAFANLDLAKSALIKNDVDGFATNKGILNEVLDDLNKASTGQFKILEGRWGLEHMGMAIPKERAAALPFVQSFGQSLKQSGELQKIAAKAGLRGLVNKE